MKRKAARPPENAVVLVLGAKVFENRLSTTLQNRVQAAADYLRAHPEAVCITTGGQGRDEPRAEGDAAKQALEALSIAPERITAETRSRTTLENLRFSKAILERAGRGPAVAIATQGYHMRRACMMARHIGLAPYPLYAVSNPYALPKNVCRELLATMKFLLLNRKG